MDLRLLLKVCYIHKLSSILFQKHRKCESGWCRMMRLQLWTVRVQTFALNSLLWLHFSYVERVSEMLRQKQKQADILVLKRASLAERRQEALEEQAKLEPRIDLLAAQAKELQILVPYAINWQEYIREALYCVSNHVHKYCFSFFFLQIEGDISKRYNKRPVNLMGVNV